MEFYSTHQSLQSSPCFLISVCAFSLSAGRPTEGPSASAEALLMPVLEGKCYVIIHSFFTIRYTSNLDGKKSLGYLQELGHIFDRWHWSAVSCKDWAVRSVRKPGFAESMVLRSTTQTHGNNHIPLGVELYHGAIWCSYTTKYVKHGQAAHVLQKAVFKKP